MYVAAAGMVGVGGLPYLYFGIWFGLIGAGAFAVACGLWGALGVVTAGGLLRPRPWAWWCVVAWTISCIAIYAWFVLRFFLTLLGVLPVADELEFPFAVFFFVFLGPQLLLMVVLLIWLLKTRRQVFFPTKPESEE